MKKVAYICLGQLRNVRTVFASNIKSIYVFRAANFAVRFIICFGLLTSGNWYERNGKEVVCNAAMKNRFENFLDLQ